MDKTGPYEILDRIGTGGMGTVYRARHGESGEVVALKVMRADVSDDPVFVRRFQREAQIARSLESEHIVRTVDAGVDDGTPWIAMELVEGESLAAYVRRAGPLPAGEAVDIATQIARGLEAAHRQGVVHRDVSPQNVLVTADGVVKVADFGVARAEGSLTLTVTAAFMGKPAYAAPEIIQGAQADIRSDIYSLGVVLFEMLTGRQVFLAPTPLAVMDMHVREPPPQLEQLGVRVPAHVQEAMRRCLEKDPRRRFQTPGDLLAALSGQGVYEAADTSVLAEEGATLAMGSGGGSGPPRTSLGQSGGFKRRRWLFIAGGGAAAALVGFAVALALIAPSGGADERLVSEPGATRQQTSTPSSAVTSAPTGADGGGGVGLPGVPELADGKLAVGSDIAHAPFEFYIEGTKTADGLDIDLAKALAAELGIEVEFINSDFGGLIGMLASENFDVIMSAMTITEQRSQQIDFVPYAQIDGETYGIGVRKSSMALKAALEEAMAAIQTSGEYAAILQAWGLSDAAIGTTANGEHTDTSLALTMHDNFFEAGGARNPTGLVPAGEQITIRLINAGVAIHNMRFAGNDNEFDTADDSVSTPTLVAGGQTASLTFVTSYSADTYAYRCDFHPTEMQGEFSVY